jgi:hypothetical protein
MIIFIKTLVNTMVPINVSNDNTIEEIKNKFELIEGIPIGMQTFIFNGKRLDDSKTIKYYNIWSNSTIDLALNMQFTNTIKIDTQQFNKNS